MSLAQVKAEYLQEQKVLQAWRTRIDHVGPIEEDETPESQMSLEYKEGWTLYLDAVLDISDRMIKACNLAQQNGGNTTALKQLLSKEADDYDALAAEAQNRNLTELRKMLKHEADSRRAIVDEL
jgi:hypothetical protein